MLKIYDAASIQEAYLLIGLLGHQGIAARIFNENAQGALGQIPFIQAYPEVWIEEDADLEQARELVARFEHGPDEAGTVQCGECGEENPCHFRVCWNCGGSLS